MKINAGLPLPSTDAFARALYTIDIGQNDFTSNLKSIGVAGVKQYLPSVVNQISWTVKVSRKNNTQFFAKENCQTKDSNQILYSIFHLF